MTTLTDIYVGVKKDDPKRRKNDFYPTPPLATYVLCKYAKPPHNVIEPCAGRGNISIELERQGHSVESYDLHKYDNPLTEIHQQDALDLPWKEPFCGIVTNPPYHKNLPHKLSEKFIDAFDYTAMFVRLTFLEGIKRKKLFTKHPPSDIIFLSDRIRFSEKHIEPIERDDQIGGMIAYMWIIWDKRKDCINTKVQWVKLDDEYEEWRESYNSWAESRK